MAPVRRGMSFLGSPASLESPHMALKKTDRERLKAGSITDRLSKSAPAARYGAHLVKKLHALAAEKNTPLNEIVAELLGKGLHK
jgi:hypothetical protein